MPLSLRPSAAPTLAPVAPPPRRFPIPLSCPPAPPLPPPWVAAPAVAGAELMPLAGKKLSGDFVSIDDKGVVLKVSGSALSTPPAEVMYLDLGNAPVPDK